MKHDLKITFFLIALFLAAQLVGLTLLKYSLKETVDSGGGRVVVFDEAKVGEIPQMSGLGFLVYILVGIGVGTGLVLLLARFRKANLWRAWFFLAVFVSIDFALKAVVPPAVAMVVALSLALWKIYKPNVVVHNLSEVLMYSGIAIFLVPLLNSMKNEGVLGLPGNVFWAAFILVLISVYDFIAVFKSKHMVSMAQFQTQSKVFAGLLIPYSSKSGNDGTAVQAKLDKLSSEKKTKGAPLSVKKLDAGAAKVGTGRRNLKLPELNLSEPARRTAILGGGDIAFPLLFTGTVLFHLANTVSIQAAFLQSSLVVLGSTIALALLFVFAEKDKFYPAMPVITAGCFAGYGLIILFF